MRRLLELGVIAVLLGGLLVYIASAQGDPVLEREVASTFAGASHDLDPDWIAHVMAKSKAQAIEVEPSPEVIRQFMATVEPPAIGRAPWDDQPTPEAYAIASRDWPAADPSSRDRFTGSDVILLLLGGAAIALFAGWRGAGRGAPNLGRRRDRIVAPPLHADKVDRPTQRAPGQT